jgi:hypothetical protein
MLTIKLASNDCTVVWIAYRRVLSVSGRWQHNFEDFYRSPLSGRSRSTSTTRPWPVGPSPLDRISSGTRADSGRTVRTLPASAQYIRTKTVPFSSASLKLCDSLRYLLQAKLGNQAQYCFHHYWSGLDTISRHERIIYLWKERERERERPKYKAVRVQTS